MKFIVEIQHYLYQAYCSQLSSPWDPFVKINNIRVTQTFENTTVPLAMRDESPFERGFQGMQRQDSWSGSGNHYTTFERPYDPRLGRWWGIDPLASKYPGQSPYSGFNNNPIYFADPTGAEGEATVDKEKNKVTVDVKVHYMKGQKKDFESYEKDFNEQWGDGTKTVNVDGEDYDVTYNLVGIEHETSESFKEGLDADPTSNYFRAVDNSKLEPGSFNSFTREIMMNNASAREGTGSHETGHALGLGHVEPMSRYKYNPHTRLREPTEGSIMSYADKRVLSTNEVKLSVQNAIRLSKTVEYNNVKVHIRGRAKDPANQKSDKIIPQQ